MSEEISRFCAPTGRPALPRMGFGASPLGSVFGPVDQEQATRAVHAALESGVTYFDVAPYYGLTRAESVLGRALSGVPRESYLLSTKVGRCGRDEFDFSAARVVRSAAESLDRLGTGHVDILLCHDIEYGSLEQVVEETLPALRELRDRGVTRFVGISGLPLAVFRYVLARTDVDVVLNYCRYTLADTSLAETLPLFRQRGVAVINAAPLCMGLLTRQGPPDWHPASEELRQAARRACALCDSEGFDVASAALQFAFSNPQIDCTLVGVASEDELRRNLAAMDATVPPTLIAAVRAEFDSVRERIWQCGRPENS